MQPLWRSILTDCEVSANPQAIWTKVLDYVGPSRKLRFRATGTWTWQKPPDAPAPNSTEKHAATAPKAPAATSEVLAGNPEPAPAGGDKGGSKPGGSGPTAETGTCGPDGDAHIAMSSDALFPDGLVGTLIGKIGGSSATVKNSGAFIVGSYCVIDVDD